MEQALTNALLMDAVVGSLQSQKAIYAASKLAYFDKMKFEGVYHSHSTSLLWLNVHHLINWCLLSLYVSLK